MKTQTRAVLAALILLAVSVPVFADVVVVKLTATGGANNAANPGNALNSDDSRSTFDSTTSPLSRTTGDAGALTGTLTKVEIGIEYLHLAPGVASQLQSWWNGSQVGSDHNCSSQTSDTVLWFDITTDRTWLLADFNSDSKLESRVTHASAIVAVSVDQTMYQITYTPGADQVKNPHVMGLMTAF